jgi:hypothetical protein
LAATVRPFVNPDASSRVGARNGPAVRSSTTGRTAGEMVLALLLLVQDEQDDYQDRFKRPP